MKEPILSREEVDKLAGCCFIHSNQLTPHQWRSFAERLESRLLEKLCGLTDARIARLRAAIEGECDGLHVDYHRAKAILAYLDDDRA